jgi:hypothetical protein
MSAFVIVEITNPRSTPMELQAIASSYGVPIVPIKTMPFEWNTQPNAERWLNLIWPSLVK